MICVSIGVGDYGCFGRGCGGGERWGERMVLIVRDKRAAVCGCFGKWY
ncbi:hypothetical protein [Bartonella grahamii]|nr:hypothetical protein [Bartonella grahamii]